MRWFYFLKQEAFRRFWHMPYNIYSFEMLIINAGSDFIYHCLSVY